MANDRATTDTIFGLFAGTCEGHPDATFIKTAHECVTCTEMNFRAERMELVLLAQGGGKGTRVEGANASRIEVENAFRALDSVADVVVCGLPDNVMGFRIAAAIVLNPGAEVSPDAIKASLRERIAGSKIPSDIPVIEPSELLRTPSGKIGVADMRDLIADRLVKPNEHSSTSNVANAQ